MPLTRGLAAALGLLLAAPALMVAPAAASDRVASMGTGGLVLGRTDGIEMRSEDLYLSAREVRIRYRFFNRTGADITTTVAFPMPDVVGRPEGDIGISLVDPRILTPFTTEVNGRPIATNVEQRAFLDDVEQTDLLRGLGIPLSPHREEAGQALAALPRPQIEQLIDLGVITDRSWIEAGVAHVDLVPMWTLKTTHYWTQVFPAGRVTEIHHRYTPAVGGSAGSLFGNAVMATSEYAREQSALYCTDTAFLQGAQRMRSRGLHLSETWVDFTLTTGANRAEPIGDFRLVIDKGSSRNLMSFCGEGVRKIGPTRIEIRRRNFAPTQDLSVLILTGERLAD